MIIGFDIDDTLTNTYDIVRKYIYKYDKYYSNNNHLINNFDGIIKGLVNDEITTKFFLDYSHEMASSMPIKEYARKVLNKLHKEGFKIYFITARSDRFYKNAQEFCEQYLKNNNIYYDKLITGQANKLEACIREKIDIMIDDGIHHCEWLNNNGIKTILFNSKSNENDKTNIKRVYNWKELYNCIHNFVKVKNN